VFSIEDSFGYPCLSFDVLPSRRNDLSRITAARTGQRMAAVIGDQVRSAPTLDGDWFGIGAIEGHFRDEELVRLAESFRRLDGPLRIVETR
jgi:preprotein translocase subunit SecD